MNVSMVLYFVVDEPSLNPTTEDVLTVVPMLSPSFAVFNYINVFCIVFDHFTSSSTTLLCIDNNLV